MDYGCWAGPGHTKLTSHTTRTRLPPLPTNIQICREVVLQNIYSSVYRHIDFLKILSFLYISMSQKELRCIETGSISLMRRGGRRSRGRSRGRSSPKRGCWCTRTVHRSRLQAAVCEDTEDGSNNNGFQSHATWLYERYSDNGISYEVGVLKRNEQQNASKLL